MSHNRKQLVKEQSSVLPVHMELADISHFDNHVPIESFNLGAVTHCLTPKNGPFGFSMSDSVNILSRPFELIRFVYPNFNLLKLQLAVEKGYVEHNPALFQLGEAVRKEQSDYESMVKNYNRYQEVQSNLYNQLLGIQLKDFGKNLAIINETARRIRENDARIKAKLLAFKQNERKNENTWKEKLKLAHFTFPWSEEDQAIFSSRKNKYYQAHSLELKIIPDNKFMNKIYYFYIRKNAKRFASYAKKREEEGHPLRLFALQGIDKISIDIYLEELKKLGCNWLSTANLAAGYSGQVCTIYNNNLLTLNACKSQKHELTGNSACVIDFFTLNHPTSDEPSQVVCANYDLMPFANVYQVESTFAALKRIIGNLPAVILGNANHHFPEPKREDGIEIPGQVGAATTHHGLRDHEPLYRLADFICENIPFLGWIMPRQIALVPTTEGGLSPAHLKRDESAKVRNHFYPVNPLTSLHLITNTTFIFNLKALFRASQEKNSRTNKSICINIRNAFKKTRLRPTHLSALSALMADNLKRLTKKTSATPEDRQRIVNQVAVEGIRKYLARHQQKIAPLYLFMRGARGVNRAHCYLTELLSQQHSCFYKQIILYALLIAAEGKTLESDIILGSALKEELKQALQKHCFKAANHDPIKAKHYLGTLDLLIEKILLAADQTDDQALPLDLQKEIARFDRMMGQSDTLIKNILSSLAELEVPAIKRLAVSDDPERFSKIQTICRDLGRGSETCFSSFGLFNFAEKLDPKTALILRSVTRLERNRIIYPAMNSLEDVVRIQQKCEVLAEFEQDIERVRFHAAIRRKLGLDSFDGEIDAYRQLTRAIKDSGPNESVFDILFKHPKEFTLLVNQDKDKIGIAQKFTEMKYKGLFDHPSDVVAKLETPSRSWPKGRNLHN